MPTTPLGTAYTVTQFTSSAGETRCWRSIPNALTSAPNVPLVIFCHGNPGSVTDSADDQFNINYAEHKNWLADHGWAWVEGHGAGANWGNQAARDAYRAMFNDVSALWSIGSVVVIGRSMGGLVGAYLAARDPVIAPKCVGYVALSATQDLTNRYNQTTADRPALLAAYGVATQTQYNTAVVDYDPMLRPATEWDGRNAIQQWDISDTTVPYALHGKLWRDRYGSRLAVNRVMETSGGNHNTTPNDASQIAATLQFLGDVLPPPPTLRVLDLGGARIVAGEPNTYLDLVGARLVSRTAKMLDLSGARLVANSAAGAKLDLFSGRLLVAPAERHLDLGSARLVVQKAGVTQQSVLHQGQWRKTKTSLLTPTGWQPVVRA